MKMMHMKHETRHTCAVQFKILCQLLGITGIMDHSYFVEYLLRI